MKIRLWPWTLALFVLLSGAASGEQTAGYDGKWWLSVTKDQRLGFFEGYAGCYIYDTDGKVKFKESGYSYEPRLTNYLQHNPGEEAKPIEELLWKMATPPHAQTVKREPSAAEQAKGRYGYLDGDYWRQVMDAKRLGLVEGFLYCYSRNTKARVGTFSRPPLDYVNAISEWYGIKKEDPSEINPDRINTKIPDVLFKFRDKKAQLSEH